jgi:hypothetical protein
MLADNGNLLSLTGGLKLKVRIQHPGVHERTDRGEPHWYFRYWDDVLQPDGILKPIRRIHSIGPSRGDNRLSKKQAEVERDKFLAKLNKPTIEEKIADGAGSAGEIRRALQGCPRKCRGGRALPFKEADPGEVPSSPRAEDRPAMGQEAALRNPPRRGAAVALRDLRVLVDDARPQGALEKLPPKLSKMRFVRRPPEWA